MLTFPARRNLGALVVTLAALIASSACGGSAPQQPTPGPSAPAASPVGSAADAKARNVILIQGDGMGVAHRELIRLALKGRGGELAMNQLQYSGLVHTESADSAEAVTDSAAAATAFATGVRTRNGSVGVDVDGQPRQTLLERARDVGKATGLVTTAQVSDASPAAFAAHVRNRASQSEIARQIIEAAKVDVVLGGGEDWWYPSGEPGRWPDRPAGDPSERSHGGQGDLVERARQAGYQTVSDGAELSRVTAGKVLGLFANEEMFEAQDEGEGDRYAPAVPLPVMTQKALDLLSADPDGFFLFVEEEGIDEMAHQGNANLVVKAGAALDETVQLAVDFAARTPNTLVLVVGDHETGGLAIENYGGADENGSGGQREDTIRIANSDLRLSVDWTTNRHTGGATPITASGPGAQRLAGFIKNTDVHDAVLAAMGLG